MGHRRTWTKTRAKGVSRLAICSVLALVASVVPATQTGAIDGAPVDPALNESIVRVRSVGSCTGTVIGTHHVLTAGHCTSGDPIGGIQIFRNDGSAGGVLVAAQAIDVGYPDAFDHTDPTGPAASDLAVIVVDTPLNLPIAELSATAPQAGNGYTIFGRGLDGAGNRGFRSAATRYQTNAAYRGFDLVDALQYCIGDSGAPFVTGFRTVFAVLHDAPEDGGNPSCSAARAEVALIADHFDWIRSFLIPSERCGFSRGTVFLALGDQPTAGGDVIIGTNYADVISGLDGNDVICGFDGDDTIRGGDGNDTIRGGSGTDRIYGDRGSDQLFGEDDRDLIWGGRNADVIRGGQGNDVLRGETGADEIYGENGHADRLIGGQGFDELDGGSGKRDYCDIGPDSGSRIKCERQP